MTLSGRHLMASEVATAVRIEPADHEGRGGPLRHQVHQYPLAVPAEEIIIDVTELQALQASTAFVGGFDSPINTTRIRMEDDDSNKVIYYTPRIEGFQFGVAYIPTATQDEQDGAPSANTSLGTINSRSQIYSEGVALGLNFVRKIDQVDVALAFGYQKWTRNSGELNATEPGRDPAHPWAFSWGINLGYRGFTFGASMEEVKDLRVSDTSTTVSNGGKSWDIGLQYDWGAHSVSLGYFEGWVDGEIATRGHDEQDKYQTSYRYKFSPGVEARASVFYQKWTGEYGTTSNDDNKGWGVVTGVLVNF
jgi:predicted porin